MAEVAEDVHMRPVVQAVVGRVCPSLHTKVGRGSSPAPSCLLQSAAAPGALNRRPLIESVMQLDRDALQHFSTAELKAHRA